jgi:uncharacterized membrane protein YeaQ/YmgE (transglycosylase-associated protein family)
MERHDSCTGQSAAGSLSGNTTGVEALPVEAMQYQKVDMSLIAWIVLGLISGFVASKIVNKAGEGILLDILLGIVGAVVGGFIFNQFGHVGVTGLDLRSMLVAVVGAIVVLVVKHALMGRRPVRT